MSQRKEGRRGRGRREVECVDRSEKALHKAGERERLNVKMHLYQYLYLRSVYLSTHTHNTHSHTHTPHTTHHTYTHTHIHAMYILDLRAQWGSTVPKTK